MLIALLLAACKNTDTDTDVDTDPVDTGTFEGSPCGEASAAYGATVCRHRLDAAGTFEALAVDVPGEEGARATKYLVPAADDAPLPTLFMNSGEFALHHDFLVQAFPDLYAGLSPVTYLDLIFGAQKHYIAGTLTRRPAWVGFTAWEDPADGSTALTYEEVRETWRFLKERVPWADLRFEPVGSQIDRAKLWVDPEFPIDGVGENLPYEVYTEGVGYGRVRRYTLGELAVASELAAFGFQDVLVLEEAPFDLERVVSGVVTATRQAPLSHLNVRSASRGTPNCYSRDAYADLAVWAGQIVRLECGASGLTVSAADLSEAEAFWAELRPEPLVVPEPDRVWSEIQGVLEIPTADATERGAAAARFGSKAANLAILYQRVDPAIRLDGFGVPMAFYEDFLESNTAVLDVGAGPAVMTLRDALDANLADPVFLSDGSVRRDRLFALRTAMEQGDVDPALIQAVASEVQQVWGSTEVMVRFRSSSNAEDALGFSGAGLYASASGCVADDLDGDAVGPSRCDPSEPDEVLAGDAIAEVWASLWGVAAWEERDWYGIPPDRVSMGVLANDRSQDELANIVAFTGDPVGDDPRWLVNAQAGEGSVVSPDPGEVPESVLLTLDAGAVTAITRVTPSSEAPNGEVLDDARLEELGAALWDVREVFPVDAVPPAGAEVLLDSEWKVLADGRLIVKQVRPFLDAE